MIDKSDYYEGGDGSALLTLQLLRYRSSYADTRMSIRLCCSAIGSSTAGIVLDDVFFGNTVGRSSRCKYLRYALRRGEQLELDVDPANLTVNN